MYPIKQNIVKQRPIPREFLVTGLCLATMTFAHADTVIYRWMDENSVTSFAQSKPISEQRAANRAMIHLEGNDDSYFAPHQKKLRSSSTTDQQAVFRA